MDIDRQIARKTFHVLFKLIDNFKKLLSIIEWKAPCKYIYQITEAYAPHCII